MRRTVLIAAATTFVAGWLTAFPAAHEIPRTVTVHMLVKAEQDRLCILVRVPLAAMRDIEFPQRDGFLDISGAGPALRGALTQWVLPTLEVFEDGDRLTAPAIGSVRVSLPSDRSFESYDVALAHVSQTSLPVDSPLPWTQALLDARFDYPISSARSAFAVRPGFERLGIAVVTSLRFVTVDGAVRAFELRGDPGRVQLDPRWHESAWSFVKLGALHILDGADHLLFLLCLVIPLRRIRPLVIVVTAFTAAHSMTLIGSALGLVPGGLWFPPLVETLIAASILYVALENIVCAGAFAHRWVVALGFGLVHGFGFSFALRDTMQFAGSHLLVALVSFNVGVEAGQLFVLALLVPALQALFRFGVRERIGTIVLSALVAHTAWHWMVERWNALQEYPAPSLDAGFLLGAVRVLLAVVAVATVVWLAARARIGASRAKAPGTEPRASDARQFELPRSHQNFGRWRG